MKIEPRRASALVAVLTFLLVLAAGSSASGDGPGEVASNRVAEPLVHADGAGSRFTQHLLRRGGGKYKVRFGKVVDTDSTAHDGVFNLVRGHATCKRRERLISGGLRLHSGNVSFIVGHFALIESGPVPKLRQWAVTASSDLGGAARQFFLVVAYCRTR